ncbi:type IV secretion system protein [Enterobacter cloacae]|uniref:Type IV secretion system protein n=1 Tax=Enterobacter cloacae TaxID=550 RepID=A0A377M858_ENTCL|nr:type IV secretion system protein [Enterobacter cloacae]
MPLLCEKCRIPWQVKAPELDGETRARLEKYCTVEGVCDTANSSSVITRAVLTCQKTVPLTGRIVSPRRNRSHGHCRGCPHRCPTDAALVVSRPAVARQYWVNQGGITRRMHLLRYLAQGALIRWKAILSVRWTRTTSCSVRCQMSVKTRFFA